MAHSTLVKYIEVLCKKSIHDPAAIEELNIQTENEYDDFMDGVFSEIKRLNMDQLLKVIDSVIKSHKVIDQHIFSVVYTIIDIHFEGHPNMHPDKRLSSLLQEMNELPKLSGSSVGFDLAMYIKQYNNYEEYRRFVS